MLEFCTPLVYDAAAAAAAPAAAAAWATAPAAAPAAAAAAAAAPVLAMKADLQQLIHASRLPVHYTFTTYRELFEMQVSAFLILQEVSV